MESSMSMSAAASVVVRTCVPAAVMLPLSPSFTRPALRTTGRGFRCRCSSATKDSAVVYSRLLDDALFRSAEVIQWESGKSMNAIATAQGIQIRRRCRPRYPSEGTGAERAVPRNILEQIIWDKEVEVAQRKARTPLCEVKASAALAPPPRDFVGALRAACRRNAVPALVAEVKKASPSKGLLRDHFDPVSISYVFSRKR
jgi:indole-3-glycerol phosphate synthase